MVVAKHSAVRFRSRERPCSNHCVAVLPCVLCAKEGHDLALHHLEELREFQDLILVRSRFAAFPVVEDCARTPSIFPRHLRRTGAGGRAVTSILSRRTAPGVLARSLEEPTTCWRAAHQRFDLALQQYDMSFQQCDIATMNYLVQRLSMGGPGWDRTSDQAIMSRLL